MGLGCSSIHQITIYRVVPALPRHYASAHDNASVEVLLLSAGSQNATC